MPPAHQQPIAPSPGAPLALPGRNGVTATTFSVARLTSPVGIPSTHALPRKHAILLLTSVSFPQTSEKNLRKLGDAELGDQNREPT